MALPQTQILYTVEEYLAFERSADERHGYLDGQIWAMVGESLQHGIICTNLVRELGVQLRGTPCLPLSKDMKLRSGSVPTRPQTRKGLFSYIDCLQQTVASLDGARRHERLGQVNLPAVVSRAYLTTCHAELGMFAEGSAFGEEAAILILNINWYRPTMRAGSLHVSQGPTRSVL